MLIGSTSARHQRGAAFIWALLMLVFLTFGLGRYLDVLSTREQRALEADLLWKGEQYRRAIEAYYQASPGEEKQFPNTIDDLLVDPRLLTYTRHLRQAYPDPLTGEPFAEVHDSAGRLIGIRSTSTGKPIKIAGFPAQYAHFSNSTSYEQWEFIFLP